MSTVQNIDWLEITLTLVLAITAMLGVYWGFTDPDFFTNRYMMEDGVIEYTTVVLLLAACLVTGTRWLRYRRQRPFRFTLISLLVVMFFFFIAGEEISWGQRILGLETTDYFKEHNDQEELNLHNLVVGDVKINKLFFGVILTTAILVYMIIIPLLYHKVEYVRNQLDRWYIPVPRLRHSVGYMLLLLTITVIPPGKKWELLEFGSVLIFFLILWSPLNEYRFGDSEIKSKPF